jgi:peptide/nickel transport system ATP-binding protein
MENTIVEAQNLKKHFPIKLTILSRLRKRKPRAVHAVDGVDLKIRSKEIFGIVGESGCGKTTTGLLLLGLIQPTTGRVFFKNKDLASFSDREMQTLRRKMQIIFQDPYESLNPSMTVYGCIAEPIQVQKMASMPEEVTGRVKRALEDVDLVPPEEFLYRFPHELSGGQRQRVAIARAFVLEPEFVVADEPVSMLDASVRSRVLDLMLSLVEKFDCGFLYITHDIALSRYICDRIAVMYSGKIVEKGEIEDVIKNPQHPYTEALLSAVPVPDPAAKRTEIVLGGEVPSALDPPSGCRFHPRCPYAQDKCNMDEPKLAENKKDRYVACHFPLSN